MMKNGVKILNFARGELVVNADIIAALETGKVATYVTDFPDEELLKAKNVIAIPHLGASTNESEVNCATMAAEQTRHFLENGNIRNSVNFPEAEMERNSSARIIIANRNVPNMVSQISTTLAQGDINIANMLNRNKKDIAYNIIDTDHKEIEETLIDKLKSIEGVFMVRVLPGK